MLGIPSTTVTDEPTLIFDSTRAFNHLRSQVNIGPRIPGTSGIEEARAYMEGELQKQDWIVEREPFIPNESWNSKGIEVTNLVARPNWYDTSGEKSFVYLAAHYDTRRLADQEQDAQKQKQPVPGANDGASGTAILLELARVIRQHDIRGVRFVFFDAEDQGGIEGWPWIVGSTYHAEHLSDPKQVQAFILVDMVGDEDPQFYWEGNSDASLREQIWTIAAELGYQDAFIPSLKYTMLDDHVPFKDKGIPVVDIIDFDYPYWHTTSDNLDHVSASTLEMVGKTVESWLLANKLANGSVSIATTPGSTVTPYFVLGMGVIFAVLLVTLQVVKKRRKSW